MHGASEKAGSISWGRSFFAVAVLDGRKYLVSPLREESSLLLGRHRTPLCGRKIDVREVTHLRRAQDAYL